MSCICGNSVGLEDLFGPGGPLATWGRSSPCIETTARLLNGDPEKYWTLLALEAWLYFFVVAFRRDSRTYLFQETNRWRGSSFTPRYAPPCTRSSAHTFFGLVYLLHSEGNWCWGCCCIYVGKENNIRQARVEAMSSGLASCRPPFLEDPWASLLSSISIYHSSITYSASNSTKHRLASRE